MAEKKLNTRILLRYDEYTNWYNKNPKLLKGEIAIATIPENHTDPSTGAVTQIPAVVMKVGTGAETGSNYRDLPFISAKAADVLAACKTEDGLKAFVNSVIADAGIASDDAMQELAGRVTTNKNDIAAIKEDIGTVDNLETTNKDITGAINELKTAIGTGGTAAVVTLTEIAPKPGYAKTYSLKQGETAVGTIDIPKDMVVQSGTVETKAEAGDWGEAGTYIHLVLANATSDDIYVNVGTLVDIYKAQASAAQVQIAIDSATREISATIVDGSVDTDALADNAVTTAKIADKNVTLAKLSQAVQDEIGKAHEHDFLESELDKIADGDVEKWNEAAQKANTALQEHQDISGKADKVSGATSGNFAGLDANGNLTDSGKKAADFVRSITGVPDTTGKGIGGLSASSNVSGIVIVGLDNTAQANLELAKNSVQGAGTGLKVVDKQVEFDEAVTFIFDCGGAEV